MTTKHKRHWLAVVYVIPVTGEILGVRRELAKRSEIDRFMSSYRLLRVGENGRPFCGYVRLRNFVSLAGFETNKRTLELFGMKLYQGELFLLSCIFI